MRAALTVPLLLLALAAGGCVSSPHPSHVDPRPGYVQDMAAFDQFIATRPTADGFRLLYPDVTLVLPGDMATRELRHDNSRYFADLDADGRISGGRFQ